MSLPQDHYGNEEHAEDQIGDVFVHALEQLGEYHDHDRAPQSPPDGPQTADDDPGDQDDGEGDRVALRADVVDIVGVEAPRYAREHGRQYEHLHLSIRGIDTQRLRGGFRPVQGPQRPADP